MDCVALCLAYSLHARQLFRLSSPGLRSPTVPRNGVLLVGFSLRLIVYSFSPVLPCLQALLRW